MVLSAEATKGMLWVYSVCGMAFRLRIKEKEHYTKNSIAKNAFKNIPSKTLKKTLKNRSLKQGLDNGKYQGMIVVQILFWFVFFLNTRFKDKETINVCSKEYRGK